MADRRGDVLLAQGKKAEARKAYQAAYKAMDDKVEYRRLVEAKLTALGAAPAALPRQRRCRQRGGQVRRCSRWCAAGRGGPALAACSSDKPKPTPLEAITPQIAGRQVWSARIDGAAPGHASSPHATASSPSPAPTAPCWRCRPTTAAKSGAPMPAHALSAGVGSDGRFAAVVTRDNEVVVFERGAVKWRTRLASRGPTPPLVAGERVFVMGVDRVVTPSTRSTAACCGPCSDRAMR